METAKPATAADEVVVLLHDDGLPSGTALKREVHHTDTPLHLAFSCYVQDDDGRLLMTRRALTKRTWPGVWTNSFCGHPAPGEPMEAALQRRARQELGADMADARPALPDFRYRAVDAGGVVENEVCPVFLARLASPIDPDPGEVMDIAWVSPTGLGAAVERAGFAFSPWLRLQLPGLLAAGLLTDRAPS